MTCSWMRKSSKLLFLAASALVSPSTAVLYGDEIYQDVPGGKFWAFYNEGIAVIDPETCSIETTITKDNNGETLPTAFNDGVYMQSKDDSEGYILIGSRVDETNVMGDTVSHMYAISTTDREVIAKAEVGSRVVHSYGVWPKNEFWLHSDGDGKFYVVHLDDLTKTSHDDIEAKVVTPAHGKLLWDESPKLKDRGFATSTGEKYLFEIDMVTKEQVFAYDFSIHDEIEGCNGLHAIAYSPLNEHVYAECAGFGGALEFDVSNDDIMFVQQFRDATGALYETPDGRYVVASSKGSETLYVFKPNGTGRESSVEYVIDMKGRPSTVSFYTDPRTKEVVACAPLTENLNLNQRHDDGSVACGYYEGCTGASSALDVNLGICLHDENDTLKLKRVADFGMAETADLAEVCTRCQDEKNFDLDDEGVNGCTCTPHCGYCDPNPSYSDEESGYMCVNLDEYIDAAANGKPPVSATLIPNTGGVHQGRGYSRDPECVFGRTYRAHKRGGKYDAAVANVPDHSIAIIDMETMTKKCTVEVGYMPRKVVYAPNIPVKGVVAKASAGVAHTASLATVVVLAIVGALF